MAKNTVDQKPKCRAVVPGRGVCGRTLLLYAARPWAQVCPRCNAVNYSSGLVVQRASRRKQRTAI